MNNPYGDLPQYSSPSQFDGPSTWESYNRALHEYSARRAPQSTAMANRSSGAVVPQFAPIQTPSTIQQGGNGSGGNGSGPGAIATIGGRALTFQQWRNELVRMPFSDRVDEERKVVQMLSARLEREELMCALVMNFLKEQGTWKDSSSILMGASYSTFNNYLKGFQEARKVEQGAAKGREQIARQDRFVNRIIKSYPKAKDFLDSD
ncbi:hypothetical protein K432DRAFT_438663 [Lepidopterella palustris CBS 459.81]|uniref:Uncharacterized protein n=1 Tax=Lepidopterella palustris CBS 459.81 TaxID=1314670 RepID=A0A8E2EM00_9PEZI|nr:hypothetical protein K432DRAFT_438663 [Lepidopterella palustris CBS 459.81]